MERRKKVLCPIERKGPDGPKTFWMRVGNGWLNKDGSTNVWLDAYPANGQLHIRDVDEPDSARGNRQDSGSAGNSDDPLPF